MLTGSTVSHFSKHINLVINRLRYPAQEGGRGGGEGGESARADSNFQGLPCHLNNTYDIHYK